MAAPQVYKVPSKFVYSSKEPPWTANESSLLHHQNSQAVDISLDEQMSALLAISSLPGNHLEASASYKCA